MICRKCKNKAKKRHTEGLNFKVVEYKCCNTVWIKRYGDRLPETIKEEEKEQVQD